MIQLVWEFIVRPDDIREFETHYSSDGTWAELFRKSAGYRGTVLWRDATARCHYLAVDSWESAAAHAEMKTKFYREYEELDRDCMAFTESEKNLGAFEVT